MKIFLGFFLSVSLLSCQQNDHVVLSPDKMEKIIWELTQADIFTQDFISKDSSKNLEKENLKLQLKIFAKNKTDRKSFYKSYDYYLKHEELLKPLLDTIVVRNGRIREYIRLKKIIKPKNEQVK
jgi:2-succinyl-5-enolpyruvyl-6-hydroxy-3-cyclohexene-1-carboxylate synthase